MDDLLTRERLLWSRGLSRVAGVDEAGRGALFGPVVAAAVVLNPEADLSGIRDSKTLSESTRERLFDQILAGGHLCATAGVDAAVIDEINILAATLSAMASAVLALSAPPDWVLVDGNQLPALPYQAEAVVHGDRDVASIAAASIVAKVTRDRMIRRLATDYPEYGLSRNKGYGTRAHLEALRRFGPTPLHRRSFKGVLR